MDASTMNLHREEERRSKAFRVTHLGGQAAARSHALHLGSILRAANAPTFPWVSSWSRMPYSLTRGPDQMDWLSLVCGRRHRQILRHDEPRGPSRHSERENPRPSVSAAHSTLARKWIPGGMEVQHNPQWMPTGRRNLTNPQQYLPGQVRSVCRKDTFTSLHTRKEACS